MKKQLITTTDGSHSFYLEEMDEHYHSKHGSIAETQHIFIQAGFNEVCQRKKHFNIFEVGMGTGLNVFLTAIAAERERAKVFMKSIEAFPLQTEEAKQLNFAEYLEADTALFERIHSAEWEKAFQLNENFRLHKVKGKLQGFTFNEKYDLIYFDAFAPEKQEELWTEEIFTKLFEAMNEGGILVTYCVKGIIRRRLQGIGFEIEKLPGPKNGKREMLRARKSA
jgi:tRNA U34 5-methylaminomethyl-2-thiouridine-forming methyltransferase MnmC